MSVRSFLEFQQCSTRTRLERSGDQGQPSSEQEPTCTKIYYASRTHSQLSQVLHELKKLDIQLSPSSVMSLNSAQDTSHAASATSNAKRNFTQVDREEIDPHVDIRSVSLASRKQLCINEKLKTKVVDMDEACRQMLGGAYTF